MKKCLIVFVILACPGLSWAGGTLNLSQGISFGTYINSGASGEADMDNNGLITLKGTGLSKPSSSTSFAGAVVFTGTGLSSSKKVDVSVTGSPITLSNGTGGTISVDSFKFTGDNNISPASPTDTIYISADAKTTAASTPGTYTGSILLEVKNSEAGTFTILLPITITILRAITVSQNAAMNFGAIGVFTGNSTIRLDTNSAASVVSGIGGVDITGTNPVKSAGKITIAGNQNVLVNIVLSPASMTITGPGTAMTVNNFVCSPSCTNINLGGLGTVMMFIGADLKVNTNQAKGVYAGTYTITVNY